jgi:hypothetical protein
MMSLIVGLIVVLLGCFNIFLGAQQIVMNEKFPPASKLIADKNGIIHHPTYGEYPKIVEYKQGMTLHPGQEASVKLPDELIDQMKEWTKERTVK